MKTYYALGFTLIELMVTVSMMAIVLTIGVPSFMDTIRNSVLTGGINEFIATLNFARSEAVKRGINVTVRKTSTSSSVGWEGGWQVFTDDNANGELDSGTDLQLLVHEILKANYTLRGNNNVTNYISYQASGIINTIGSFALCDNSVSGNPTTRTARLISINILGRITLDKDTNNDGIIEFSDGSPFTSCTSP